MSVEVVQSSVQLTSTVQVKNLSNSFNVQARKIEQELAGLWKLALEIPGTGTRSKPAESHLRVHVAPISNLKSDYRHMGVVTISLSLETLEGEVQKKHSFEWDMRNQAEEKWVNLMTWSALWTDNTHTRRDDGFRMIISLSSIPALTRPAVNDPILLNSLVELMEGQDIIDTKFLVYSRRSVVDGRSGASEPLPVYANSQLLRSQCEHFDHMLGNAAFSESQLEDFDQPPTRPFIDEYEDDDDSDLGYFSGDEAEAEAEDHSDDLFGREPGSARSTRSARSASRPRSNWTTLSNDSLSTIDQAIGNDLEKTVIENDSEEEEAWSSKRLHRKHCRHHNRFGKVVEIPDFAYVTWKAVIFYLCTSQISFAPLTSSGRLRTRSPSERSQGLPSKASAKSIYRAADKLGLSDLATRALEHIKSQLTKENVIKELFSKFSSRFDDVRDLELQFVFDHWEDLKSSAELQGMLGKVASGDIPHATKILATLVAH